MKLHDYPETESLYIELGLTASAERREVTDGVNIDLDADGRVVDIDSASRTLDLATLDVGSLPLVAA